MVQVHSSKGASAASSPPKKKRTHKKQNNGYDASNEPIGFERGYEAEEIIGATDLDSQIMFNIKWLVTCVAQGYLTSVKTTLRHHTSKF